LCSGEGCTGREAREEEVERVGGGEGALRAGLVLRGGVRVLRRLESRGSLSCMRLLACIRRSRAEKL
jgi:hypothetical protein